MINLEQIQNEIAAEAAALLQLAYQKTGVANFRSQRLEILPAIPTVSVPAGYTFFIIKKRQN